VAEKAVRTIALVEDEAPIRTLVEAVLGGGGYRVVLIADPTQAVEIIRREAPDLVLCDIAMPVLDGYGVLKALQADPETARFPVVFLTAHREFTERVQAFRFGVVDYVAKPFTREMLLRKIEKVLQGLQNRSGVRASEEAGDLIAEAQREVRTGVVTVTSESGAHRVVIHKGEVVEQTAPPEGAAAVSAEFHELDPRKEQIVAHDTTHDPTSLPGTDAKLPSLDSLPEVLRTVLVVDDNAFFRRFLKDVLSLRGLTVYEAEGGEAGLQIALEKRPWLILTDVSMPGVDGFEFCRRVRSHSLIRHTPLIFLSGWDDYKDRYKGMEVGGDEYLSKETPVRELLIRIQLLLKRYSDLGSRPRSGPGMQGSIEVIGAPGFLQMCHLGRLSGTCTVRAKERTVEVRFREGEIVAARSGALEGAEAVFDFLAWREGHFDFAPGDPGSGAPLGETFDQLVLEGCRRLDEGAR
jgi:DNA-binding response OmpR family regulator